MFGNLKFLTVLAVSAFFAVGSAHAMVVHQGTDTSGSTTNSDAAFVAWQAAVSSFTVDDMTGIACGGGSCSTALGNTFDEGVGALSASNFNGGVVSGPNLRLVEVGDAGSFTWHLQTPSNAFGFFAFDNDGGTLTVNFDDGSMQEFDLLTASGSSDNLFWGITGVGANIASITITSEDPPGYSTWDRFVFGATVPVPAALPLFLSGLAFFGFVARRRARAATA
jgi:hypothetical protein